MKPLKNSILFLCFLTITSFVYSQQRGGMGNSPQNNQMMLSKMKPEDMAKMVMYDFEKVIKKLKIKDKDGINFVSKSIANYNSKINEIKVFNYEILNDVASFLNKKKEEAKFNNDPSLMKEAKLQASEMLAPIRQKVVFEQKALNSTFEEKLSKKQYKSWLKYEKAKLKELKPKSPQGQMQAGQRPQGSGQRQGMGRGGY